ncbi:uncharacterized protein LOC131022202 [Salvia miltiorrhiza]|uniref:uncharacterized protein LOC131022202 n=1 Tax=Salvia miltiorrhiza TaxID=226208 RepID=UPI0025ACAF15|nr:uncharacterized protein LOC131022202 [Salvia miltiorrhiza]
MLHYLSRHLSKSDAARLFEQLNPDQVLNCRDPRCSSQERLLDDENVQTFSYHCSTYVLIVVTDDFIGAYIKAVLTQSMCRLGSDDVHELFLSLKHEFNATDNFHLFQALSSKGEQLLQGMGVSHIATTASQSNMNVATLEEHTMKNVTESMGAGIALVHGEEKAETEARSSSVVEMDSPSEAYSQPKTKKQKYQRLAQDVRNNQSLVLASGNKRLRKTVYN